MANRIRRNCSDNVINDVTYKKRLTEYKAYLMKSGHSEKDIYISPFVKERQYLEEKH